MGDTGVAASRQGSCRRRRVAKGSPSIQLGQLQDIVERFRADPLNCAVAPSPELLDRIRDELQQLRGQEELAVGSFLGVRIEPNRLGFNDGVIIPPDQYPAGTPAAVIRSAALDRSPLRGTVRVIVVLVDFSDKAMTATQNQFNDLFFSTGVLAHGSVREYYREVTNGLVEITGEVVGPYRMPQTLATYANGASGIGPTVPNGSAMARDAVIASDPVVDFTPYDNDGNGYVDAFIVVHAGGGAEQTGSSGDIWSHKSTLDGGSRSVDATHIFGYLTVPEDARIGVCAHELGHLLFGFPDLYDTDYSSQGIGNWCLMSGGSWNTVAGAQLGDVPAHASAWCKVNQGWATVTNQSTTTTASLPDVKDGHNVIRMWKDAAGGNEYFLLENRQRDRFDAGLPSDGLLIWHIDESQTSNRDETHYKVALFQADGKKDLENNVNRGDAGDPYPGSSNNAAFTASSNPNSHAYNGTDTCVSVTNISPSGPTMSAQLKVSCVVKLPLKDAVDRKSFRKELLRDKLFLEKRQPDKRFEKPQADKASAFDKPGDWPDWRRFGGGGGWEAVPAGDRISALESRVAALEQSLSGGAQPFIESALRPDLSEGAYLQEEDLNQRMAQGDPSGKRALDSPSF